MPAETDPVAVLLMVEAWNGPCNPLLLRMLVLRLLSGPPGDEAERAGASLSGQREVI